MYSKMATLNCLYNKTDEDLFINVKKDQLIT